MSLRIIFMGTPQYSVPTLNALVEAGHDVVAVYSQPPRRGGRGMVEKKSDVHTRADELGIDVLTPLSLRGAEEQEQFAAFNADIAVVVAYGLILPQVVLDAPRLGCVNGHASLLPRWRGAAPIQRAIEAGDNETGVMIMQMEAGLDTGPVMLTQKTPILPTTTAGELHDTLAEISASAMVKALDLLEKNMAVLVPQNEDGLTYAKKIAKSETRIGWHKTAVEVDCHIRAMSPFPGAWCEMEFGGKLARVKILACELADGSGTFGEVLDDELTIACATKAIRPIRLQKAGKQAADLEEFLRGNKIPKGTVLS